MIKKSKQKVYYEDEVIESVFCDKCGKEITEDDDFIVIRVDEAYLHLRNERKTLSYHEIGYSKLLCYDCAELIEELLKEGDI